MIAEEKYFYIRKFTAISRHDTYQYSGIFIVFSPT